MQLKEEKTEYRKLKICKYCFEISKIRMYIIIKHRIIVY